MFVAHFARDRLSNGFGASFETHELGFRLGDVNEYEFRIERNGESDGSRDYVPGGVREIEGNEDGLHCQN